jgi:hypothetical protein
MGIVVFAKKHFVAAFQGLAYDLKNAETFQSATRYVFIGGEEPVHTSVVIHTVYVLYCTVVKRVVHTGCSLFMNSF